MGKSSGGAPDYQGAAQQQQASSQQTVNQQTQQNRPNISTPFGQTNWTVGADGTPQLSQGLAGGLGMGSNSLMSQFAQANANPLDTGGPVMGGDAARDQAINSAWQQSSSRLNPMWDQRDASQQAQLAAQGLDPNSEAYRNATGAESRNRNDAYTSALNSAIGQGTQAGQAVFGQNLQAHQQALSDALAQRQSPLQGLQGLAGLAGQQPQFAQAGQAEGLQSLTAAAAKGNYDLQQQQMQNQLIGSALSAIGSVAGGAAKMSDARAKEDIQRLPYEVLPGVPLATWKWRTGFEGEGAPVGVIAQDLAKVAPEYVLEGEDGLLRVDYSFALGGA